MNKKEQQWFSALTEDRAQSADMLEKPSMRGIQRSVVDKYSDQAHFIYELLQNADDAKATIAKFQLEKEGLFKKEASRRQSMQFNRSHHHLKDQESRAVLPSSEQLDDSIQDIDDYTPKSVNYDEKIARAKNRCATELDRIEREETLYRRAKELPRYSYGWFLSLLELEYITKH